MDIGKIILILLKNYEDIKIKIWLNIILVFELKLLSLRKYLFFSLLKILEYYFKLFIYFRGQVSSIVSLPSTMILPTYLQAFCTLRLSIQTGSQLSNSTTATFANTVKGGSNSGTTYASNAANPSIYVGTSNTAAHETTSGSYIQFATPTGSSLRSILSLTVQAINGPALSTNMTVMVLGLRNTPAGWTSAALTWNMLADNSTSTANILFPLASGNQLVNVSQNFLNWASSTDIQIAGHLTVTAASVNQQVMVDVSDYVNSVVSTAGTTLNFFIYRPFRHPSYATAYGAIPADDLSGGTIIQFAGVGSSNPPTLTQFSSTTPPSALPSVPTAAMLANISSQPITFSNINSFLTSNPSFSIGSLYTPTQLSTLSLPDTLSLLNSASMPASTIDATTALTLGSKLLPNTSFSQAAKVIGGAPIQIILNANSSTIVSNLNNINFNNLGTAQISTLANVVS